MLTEPLSSPAPSRNSLLSRLGPALLFTLLVALVYADPLFVRKTFGGRDLIGYALPIEKAVHEAYRRGEIPLWIPDVSGGRPLLPNPNTGAFYPVRPLLALLSFPAAMRLFPILHWVAAGLGMLVLLRSLAVSRPAAWVAAVTYVFSGVSVSEVFYPARQPGSAVLPWIVWILSRNTLSPRLRVLVLAGLLCLDLLLGDLFTVLFAVIAAGLWLVFETLPAQRLRAGMEFAGATALAVLMAAPQIVATALWIPHIGRAVSGMKLESAFFFSISPWRLLEFVIPFPFGATWELEKSAVWGVPVFHGHIVGLFTSLYPGAIAVIAVAVAWRIARRGRRFAVAFLLGSLAIGVLPSLAPGGLGSLQAPLALRYPEKFAVPLLFAVSVLCGFGFEEIRRVRARRPWVLGVGALLALMAGGSFLFSARVGDAAARLVGAAPVFGKGAARELPRALTEAGLLWMATVIAVDLAPSAGRLSSLFGLAILTGVPIAANRKIAPTFREEEMLAPTRFTRFLNRVDPEDQYRALGESLYLGMTPAEIDFAGADVGLIEIPRRNYSEYTPALWNRGTVLNRNFDDGDLSRCDTLRELSRLAARYRDSQAFFGALALRWGIRFRGSEPMAGYRRIGGDLAQDWDELPEALPDIRLVGRARETSDGIHALNALRQLSWGEIVIETGFERSESPRPGSVRVLRRSPESFSAELTAPDPSWLFVLRGFWPYRQVLLDGEPVEVYPAQIAFSAVRIPPGRHRISWRESFPGIEMSWAGPVLGLLAAVLLWKRARPDAVAS